MSETPKVDISSTISKPGQEPPLSIPNPQTAEPQNPGRRKLFSRVGKVLAAIGLGSLSGGIGAASAESALHGGTDQPTHPLNIIDKTPIAGSARQEAVNAQTQPSPSSQPPEVTSYSGDPQIDAGIAQKQAESGGLEAAKQRLANSLQNNPKAK